MIMFRHIEGKIGRIFLSLGVFFTILGFVGILFHPSILQQLGLADWIAIFATGISLIAVGISLKTDDLVSSLADLNFDEKIATMASYIKDYVENVMHSNDTGESIRYLARLRYDISAVSRLHKHVSPQQKKELKYTVIIPEVVYIIQTKDNSNSSIGELEHIREIKNAIMRIYNEELWKPEVQASIHDIVL